MTKALAPDDPLCKERLADWLAARDFGRGVTLDKVEAMGGGQSSDMMRLRCTDPDGAERNFILRREPTSKQIFHYPDVVREFTIMEALEKVGTVPVPPMYGAESNADVIGAPFFVMGEVQGIVPLCKPSIHLVGPLLDMKPEHRNRMWHSGLSAVAALHRVNWRRTHSFLEKEAKGSPLANHLDKLDKWYDWTVKGRKFPITDQAFDYLRKHCAEMDQDEPVLLWNDCRVGNMIFSPEGELRAVIDWEVAMIGSPGIDLGYWVMMDEFHAEALHVPRLPGWPGPGEALPTYEAQSGRRIADLDYFVVLAAFFLAVTLIRQWDMGVEQGTLGPGSRFAYDNTTTQILARYLGLPEPPVDADYARHRNLVSTIST